MEIDENTEVLRSELSWIKDAYDINDKTQLLRCGIHVSNIPREATENELIAHFEKFGKLFYSHVSTARNAFFEKFALLRYFDRESVERACRVFLQPFMGTKLLVRKQCESVALEPNRTVIVVPFKAHITLDDVRTAFKDVGEVIWIQRHKATMVSVAIFFRHKVDLEKAQMVKTLLDEDIKVHPIPEDDEWYLKYCTYMVQKEPMVFQIESDLPEIAQKKERLTNILQTEKDRKTNFTGMRKKLKFDYTAPNPPCIEVKMHNCPKDITLDDLKSFFKDHGNVINFSYDESKFSDTWIVFAHFNSLLEARECCQIKETFAGHNLVMHLACEEFLLDDEYRIIYMVSEKVLNEQDIYKGLEFAGPIDLILKDSPNTAIIQLRTFPFPAEEAKKRITNGGRLAFHKYNKHIFKRFQGLSINQLIDYKETEKPHGNKKAGEDQTRRNRNQPRSNERWQRNERRANRYTDNDDDRAFELDEAINLAMTNEQLAKLLRSGARAQSTQDVGRTMRPESYPTTSYSNMTPPRESQRQRSRSPARYTTYANSNSNESRQLLNHLLMCSYPNRYQVPKEEDKKKY